MTARRSAYCFRESIAWCLAIAFALRALLPHGFMPASEPFTLQLCPAGLSVRLALPADPQAGHHDHGHHGHTDASAAGHEADAAQGEHGSHHQRADQCPFGAASFAMCAVQWGPAVMEWLGAPGLGSIVTAAPVYRHRDYRPQPRGPPAFS